jgi:FkbM family methyltransferase
MSILSSALPFFRRHKRLARVALNCVPDWRYHIRVPGVGRMQIRLRRNRSLWLRHPLTHEWYPLSVLKAFVRPTDVVWDVGANIGLYSRVFVQCLHARHVYAFEPMSENLPELRYNLRIGGIEDRVTVLPWALCNQDGVADFQVDDIQSASGALDTVYGGKACRARAALDLPPKVERVQCRTVDSILQEGSVPPPDVIKVDIEGAERMFLDGGERFFAEHSPRLLIETHGVEVMKASLEFLFDRGFYIAGCVPGSWHPTRHLRLSPDVLNRITDQYDVHFIAAAKHPEDLPVTIERDIAKLVNFRAV